MVNQSIFKTYDIRGIYPEPLNEKAVEVVSRAFVVQSQADKVVVGRDVRASSPLLFEALCKGITEAGADVVDIGLVTTPVLSFAVVTGNYQAGVMISASHNPPEYNGLKLIGPRGVQLSKETGIDEVARLVERGKLTSASKVGRVIQFDIREQYYRHIMSFAKDIKPGLNVVIDAGNGMGGDFNKPVLDQLPIKYQPLYFKPDGNFPNHPANPAEDKNLVDVMEAVKNCGADLGIAFDGDADRAIFIDDKGNKLNPGHYLLLVGKSEIEKSQDKRIYYDLRFPHIVKDELLALGAKPVLTRVGNPFYKQQLIEDGGTMAVELSGHVMFADGYGLDDGLLAVVKLINILSNADRKLSDMVAEYEAKSYYPGEINIPCHRPTEIIEKVKERYQSPDVTVDTMDGLTVDGGDWWFNIRASNTEPILRLTLETKPDIVFGQTKKKELIDLINTLDKSSEA